MKMKSRERERERKEERARERWLVLICREAEGGDAVSLD